MIGRDDIRLLVEEVLARHPRIGVAILFGSRAADRARASIDPDIAVAADQRLSADEKIGLMDDLALRCGCPVDVIDLMAVSGPILRQALSKGSVIINKAPRLLAGLIKKMWYDEADMMPNYKRIVRQRVEAFARG